MKMQWAIWSLWTRSTVLQYSVRPKIASFGLGRRFRLFYNIPNGHATS